MKASTSTNLDYTQTVKDIFRISKEYKNDLKPFYCNSLDQFYEIARKIPFRTDGKNFEILHRPKYILEKTAISTDCDDKTILIGAFCELKFIPWGIGVSGKARPEHVFPICYCDRHKKFLPFDATYPENVPRKIYPDNFGFFEVFQK